jgi:serine protease Do
MNTMKKLLFALTLMISVSLTACLPTTDVDPDPQDYAITYTEEELTDLIESLMPEASVDTTYDIAGFQAAIIDVIEEARTGVLGLIVTTGLGSGSGSGVIYKYVDGYYYMVTNEHVVADYTNVTIVYERNGLLFEISNDRIEVLGMDDVTDVAVLRFQSDLDFAVIPFADSYDIFPGQFVFAIGNPLGFDYYGTVTMGVVSGTARYVQSGTFDATLIQHDAAISPGNSGGALINLNGELVGINNLKLVDEDVTGIGFAIPSNTVMRIAEDLEGDGVVTRPYLGISTFAQVNDCGLDYGVCVEVQNGGAADNAGLEDGDVIIGWQNVSAGMEEFLEINNFNDLREAILNSAVGDSILIKYIRNEIEYISIETELDVHPDDQ